MDTSDIIRLLNADHYSPADLEEVTGICRNYPMFGLAHMLKVRIREVLGQEKDKDLKLAAVYACDRRRLFELINEVKKPVIPDEVPEENPEDQTVLQEIRFFEASNQEADVIIEQHAPYAAPPKEGELLELDPEGEAATEEHPEEAATGEHPEEVAAGEQVSAESEEEQDPDEELGQDEEPDPDQELGQDEEPEPDEELSSEKLVEMVVKDETDMEEPGPGSSEIPAIDVIERRSRSDEYKRLISNFIMGEPGPIRADQPTGLKGDVSVNSTMEHDGLITDTLARIYVKQGLYAKAIYAYERLSLKYPEKSAYFAAQIEKIKNINHS